MNKIISFLLVFCLSFVMIACGKFADGTSVWQDGMWLIPTILFLAAVYSFYRANKAYNSGGSWNWLGNKKVYSDKPANIWTIGAFWFGIIFTLVFIGVIIWQNAEK